MKRALFAALVAAVACSSSVSALPLNGYNEIANPGFETGDFTGWQHGADMAVAQDGPGHGNAATCKRAGGDLWLRQIVDDSLSPDWNYLYHTKVVDLTADIAWQGWEPPYSSIEFRLDWWDESYNSVNDPTTLPHYLGAPPSGSDPAAGYYVSDWVVADFASIEPGTWLNVNPFNRIVLPIQPRWISVEVVYNQALGESVWLDNVVLTGKCIPEPSGLLVLLSAVGAMLPVWRLRRR